MQILSLLNESHFKQYLTFERCQKKCRRLVLRDIAILPESLVLKPPPFPFITIILVLFYFYTWTY